MRGQLQVNCTSTAAAQALAEWLAGKGYWASADVDTVRTDAQLSTVERAPSGLLVWSPC